MICVFLDGPIAGDVRTDQPRRPNLRIPVPKRVTTCDCNPYEEPEEFTSEAEVVEYFAIVRGDRVAVYSCKPNPSDDVIVRMMQNWMVSDLGNPLWERHCRDRQAFT